MGGEIRRFRPRYVEKSRGVGGARVEEIRSGVTGPTSSAPANGDPLGKVTNYAIERFCGGCDQVATGTCEAVGSIDQKRYVARGSCAWASVDQVRGEMTPKGFKIGVVNPAKPQQSSAR